MATPVYKAPPAPVLFTWTGFYGGLHIGGSWAGSRNVSHVADADGCNAGFPGCVVAPNYSATLADASTFSVPVGKNGALIWGGQIGWNWQFGNWVAGIEADISGLSNHDGSGSVRVGTINVNFPAFPETYSATVKRKLDYLGTVRGRIGFLSNPALLWYVTGGLAYGEVSSSIFQDMDFPGCAGAGTNCDGSSANSASKTKFGGTVGGGAEWKLAQNWSVKGEYLYYDLGRLTYATQMAQIGSPGTAVPGGVFASATGTASARFNGHIVRFGVNYHF